MLIESGDWLSNLLTMWSKWGFSNPWDLTLGNIVMGPFLEDGPKYCVLHCVCVRVHVLCVCVCALWHASWPRRALGAIHEARDWDKVQTALFITWPDDRVQGRGKTGQQNQSTECAELLTPGLLSLSLSLGWLVGRASSLAGLQGLGWDTDRGVRLSAVARAHVRPGGLAGLVLWFGELVSTPSVESSSGFSVQFRVFSQAAPALKGLPAGSWSVWLAVLVVPP